MKAAAILVALLVSMPVWAQPRPDLTPRQAHELERGGYDVGNQYPRWCRHYDRRDYWREKKACERDWDCRRRVDRKAERCGLR